ncbi:DUF47 domain-containing protein [Anaerovorax odorimutans]|uniref:DUF47 domain-containing protein n=1 Tax=Anaerovorax odorimutans TaxID=109327 RepID=UPI00040CDCEB|nr:DUF47 family protein [Anaerovorax odorimutans]
MKRKKNENYFDIFVELVEYSCDAAKLLNVILNNYNHEEVIYKMEEMHAIEYGGDVQRHIMMKKLAREFITPISREDIMDMADAIDNVTDTIEDVLMRMYMFNILKVREDAIKFSELIVKCCDALKSALKEFHNFRKQEKIHEKIMEINHLEETGDKIFTESIRRLYVNCKDPIEVNAWNQILEYLEKCCDACEDVADVIESVMMKNS